MNPLLLSNEDEYLLKDWLLLQKGIDGNVSKMK